MKPVLSLNSSLHDGQRVCLLIANGSQGGRCIRRSLGSPAAFIGARVPSRSVVIESSLCIQLSWHLYDRTERRGCLSGGRAIFYVFETTRVGLVQTLMAL